MKEETTNKLELENGVSLGEILRYRQEYEMSKEEARIVFYGDGEQATVHCCLAECKPAGHKEIFDVERSENGEVIGIGCVHFNPEERAFVKNWLGE